MLLRQSVHWSLVPLALGIGGTVLTRGELPVILGLLGALAFLRPRLAWYGLVLVLTVEVGTRVTLFGLDGLSYRRLQSLQDVGIGSLLQPARHPEMIWEWRPGLDQDLEFVPFTTNSHGMADDEVPVAKPDDTWRIAVIGASFTLPQGIPHPLAFHTRVERSLAARGLDVELLNFATPAMDLRQAVAVFRHKALAFDPDVVLLCFPLSDLRPERRYTEPYVPPRPDQAFFSSFFLEAALGPLSDRLDAVARPDESEASRRRPLDLFGELVGAAEQAGVRVGVVFLIETISYDAEEIRGLAAAHDVPVLHLGEEFGSAHCGGARTGRCPPDFIYPLNPHPGPRTHEVFARELEAGLTQSGLLP